MRILQVTPYFAPAWAYGGPPRVMYDYAVGLVERGHSVSVLTTDVLDAGNRARPAREVLDGVHVERLPNLSNTLAWRRKKYLPRGLLHRLWHEVGRHEVVHVTDARTYLTAAAYLVARARGVPLCFSPHGSLPNYAGLRGVVKSAYDRVLVRPMLERAALLLAQTRHEAELLARHGARPETIELLPLPVDLSGADGRTRTGVLRELASLGKDERIVLFLGRIHHLKGLDVLVDAVEPLLGQGTTLVVVGRDDGQWAQIATRHGRLLADGSLRFVGPLYGSARFDAYADADVFCLTPRHWEETSVAALEAAACGCAIVVTEQTDIPGLVEAEGGFVVPLQRERIRDAVAGALDRSGELGPRARAHVQAQHDRGAVVERLEQHLLEAVSRGSRACA